jgi:hypothetical protein
MMDGKKPSKEDLHENLERYGEHNKCEDTPISPTGKNMIEAK